MKSIEAVIFDMDGLMFDTEQISLFSWEQAASPYGFEITLELFKHTIGTNSVKTKAFYQTHFGDVFPLELVYADRLRIAEEYIITHGVPVKKGLFELLEYLRSEGYKLAVATSTSRERALKVLSLAGVVGFFDAIVCGDEVEHSKPNPQIFLKAAEKLQVAPLNCVVLEDSEAGIQAAFDAGMIPVMIPDLKQPEERTVAMLHRQLESLNDVIELLELANASDGEQGK